MVKGELPVFARLLPVWWLWPPWRAPRRRLTLARPAIFGLGLGLVLRLGRVRSAILAIAGLLVIIDTLVCSLFSEYYLSLDSFQNNFATTKHH